MRACDYYCVFVMRRETAIFGSKCPTVLILDRLFGATTDDRFNSHYQSVCEHVCLPGVVVVRYGRRLVNGSANPMSLKGADDGASLPDHLRFNRSANLTH